MSDIGTKSSKNRKYLYIISMLFVTSLLVSNAISVKIISFGNFNVPAGIMTFPFAFIFGDILTEVYGFRTTRKIIWWGFLCQGLMSLFFYLAVIIPPAEFWKLQNDFSNIFGFVPRIVLAGFFAYLIGEYINSVVMSKLKVRTNGRHFWFRAIASTILGQGVDSLIFNVVAFVGIFSFQQIMTITASGVLLKVLYEILVLPITQAVTKWLKLREGLDVYDYDTNYKII